MPDSFTSITGNVTRDPELRFTNSGQATASFSVAVNRRWQDQQTKEWREQVSYFDVVAWRDLAEHVAESVTRGTRVTVSGRLEQRSWEDNETKQKRSKVEIVADDVAASLRFATAKITRIESAGNRDESRAPKAHAAAPAASGRTYDLDEEPF